MIDNTHFLGDNPINNVEDDLFNFKHYAEKVQKLIQLNSSNPEPITIGIYGKWGEGKTSFLNLIENKIDCFEKTNGGKEYLKFHFNPWRYSNEDEMLFDFFDSLSKQFYVDKNTKLQEVGKWITKYSKYLKAVKISSTVGIPRILNTKVEFNVDEIFKSLGADLEGEILTLEKLKGKVNNAINSANFKVIVFIDDLDRLDKNEIYTILKLVKLNASFNNFIFIINLDIDHVSKAIKNRYGENLEDGKLFLEKIINIPIHLPKIENDDLQLFFDIKLKKIIKNFIFLDDFQKDEVFKEISLELPEGNYKTPREIIRVLNGFFISGFALEKEVNLKDVYWIEWLKVKNIDLYDKIKKYPISNNLEVFFTNQNPTINFNDSITTSKFPNGTRKTLIQEFPNYEWYLDKMFASGKLDLTQIELIPHINLTEHFEKYFSYHIIRKVSNIKISEIEQAIEEKNSLRIKEIILELYKSKIIEDKIVYKIEELIKVVKVQNDRNFFYKFIFENLSLRTDSGDGAFGDVGKIRLIESIAKTLDEDTENDNEAITLDLANVLEVYQLCYFTRKFSGQKQYKKKLEILISLKAKESFSVDNPFYLLPTNPTKMIMHHWGEANNKEFNEYIKNTINSKQRIIKLIRNFPSFWNNSFFGALEKENYKYLKKLIDVEFLYKKSVEFDKELVESVLVSNEIEMQNFHENSEEDNFKQFIYWYKIDIEANK